MKKQILHYTQGIAKSLLHIKTQGKLFLSVVVFSFFFSTAQGQNLVQNPSFEAAVPLVPTTGPTEFYVVPGSSTITNWTYVSGAIDLHHSRHWTMGVPTGGGNQHVDLNTNGVLMQNITGMVTGGRYTLSFWTSVHWLMNCGTSNASVQLGPGGSMVNASITATAADHRVWTLNTFVFTATSTTADLTLTGVSSCYGSGGILVDLLSLTNNCDTTCEDKDWYEQGTVRAPMSNTVSAYRMGNASIGTASPVWNFKLTVDNRDDIFVQNNGRNAILATAMHTDCSFGYGILVNTNPKGGTKALAVQGNGVDNALVFGNGMSWFKNRMTIGGPAPFGDPCDENPHDPMLVINGTGTINGMNIMSDRRFKDNIATIGNTAELIKKLNPVTYQYKTGEFAARNFPLGTTYGFIAQELKEVLPYAVNQEKDGYYSVNYISIIPVLTQAIKDQQVMIEDLKAKVEANADINKQKGSLNGGEEPQKIEINKVATLFQNSPNPLNNVTFIDYYLPATATSAFIRVTDNAGRLVQAFPINKTGYGQLELNCENIASGIYYYSLIIDSKIIDTKLMQVAKN